MLVALAGSHRSGKTTLARAVSEKLGLKFVETSASAVFKDLGYKPSDMLPFSARLKVQMEILKRLREQYMANINEFAIFDRSPIDMMGYTLAHANGATDPELEGVLDRYIEDCYKLTNDVFSALIVIQPGIPLKYEEGKAPLSKGYIEHLNNLIIGLTTDERCNVMHFYMPRHRVDLEERVKAVEFAINKVRGDALEQRQRLPAWELH